MPLSREAYAEYECRAVWDERRELWRQHAHMVPAVSEYGALLGLEEVADLLADAVARCSETRHEGHGYTHGDDEAQAAFSAAVQQLLTRDFDGEARELERKIRMHKKWGGPVPAAVLMPYQGNDGRMTLFVTDRNGNPVPYQVSKEVAEMMPPPAETGAVPDASGVGYQARRHWSAKRRLRHELRRKGNA